jgi:hypothetical protein
VAGKEVLDDIRDVFREKEKCEVIIEAAFPERKYALSNNTWLIWHNVKFEKLSNGLKKESPQLKLKNSKSPPILISTLNTVVLHLDRLLDPKEVAEFQRLTLEAAHEKV